jgi:microcystin-dependent protein
MSEPFLAQIQIFAFNFAPTGWALCNGQLMAISQNTALFSLLGTTYGGNGTSNFGLPDLRSRIPIGAGPGSLSLTTRNLGEMGGEENVTLVQSEMPVHTHTARCSSNAGTSLDPGDNVWSADVAGNNEYGTGGVAGQMSSQAIAPAPPGSNLPHTNIQTYLAVNYCIALAGIYPSRS